MREFKDWEQELLLAIADTFIAAEPEAKDAFARAKGSEMVNLMHVHTLVAKQPRVSQLEFLQLLNLLNSPMLGFTWAGPWKKFMNLNGQQRESMFYAWSQSNIGKLRKAFLSLKKLVVFPAYANSVDEQNPAWEAMAYPGPLSEPPKIERSIKPFTINDADELIADIVVVGSGAGGGVVAGELAKAGWDVIVVEKGAYLAEPDFNQKEVEMITRLYDQAGAIASRDGGLALLAGSCLGGGTTVNWAGSFKTPDYVREEWARDHEAKFFMQNSYDSSLQTVSEKIGVDNTYTYDNPQNQALRKGSEALGHKIGRVPRNEKRPPDGNWDVYGYSPLGDQYGLKQGTLKTYLQDAADAGARIMVNTHIDKVLTELGEVRGVKGYRRLENGKKAEFTIKAKRVFVCAGSLHSPALLIRSGLTHPHIGRNLYVHPTMSVAAYYDEPMNPWFGPMMSVVNDHFTRIKGNYGFKIETPPTHAGLLGMSLPWTSSQQHKALLRKAQNLGNFIILTRDKFGGRLRMTPKGYPIVDYKLHSHDRSILLRGLKEAANIHLMAGAKEVIFGHNSARVFSASEGINRLGDFAASMSSWSWRANDFTLFSAHQMSTCRMGGNEKKHPVKPDGQTREIKNLYVADASVFPSASGANPMLSIMAIAHHIAQELKA
jgi:choline dehydrogenase-like flavoprotein